MAKQKQAAIKVRKKIWIEIAAPQSFNGVYIGDTHVYEPQQVVGKCITTNMMALTNDPKKQFAEMRFEITGVHDGRAETKIKSYSMTASAVKRLMRRRSDKVSDSYIYFTADAKRVRLKYFLLPKASTSGSIRADLRNETRDLLNKTIRKITFETLMHDIVSFKFQTFIRDHLGRIFPMQLCEIKYCGLETARGGEKAPDKVSEAEYFERMAVIKPRPAVEQAQESVKEDVAQESAEQENAEEPVDQENAGETAEETSEEEPKGE